MKFFWMGHASFRIEIGDQVLLLDPWIEGNPKFDLSQRSAAISGATHILITHGHADHTADAVQLSEELGIPIVGIADLMGFWSAKHDIQTIGFNKGGTVMLGDVAVTMVNASHSSSMLVDGNLVYTGAESGFVLSAEGHTVYISGDTDVMADMGIIQALHHPDIGVLCAGGHYTMDMKRAAYAAKTFFDFSTVIPCHFRTFPILEQSIEVLSEGLPGVDVIDPKIMVPIEL